MDLDTREPIISEEVSAHNTEDLKQRKVNLEDEDRKKRE